MCLKTFFYDLLFHKSNPLSTQWGYYEILKKLPNNSTILDIGVGEGIYFNNDKVINLIKQKNIKIHGIDIDPHSILIANKRILNHNLQDYVIVHYMDVFSITKKYDYVIFMESFPVISNNLFVKFIKHAQSLVKNDILLYHNLVPQDEYSKLFSFFKSTILYYITLNDFGKLTTVNMMQDILTKKCDISNKNISMNVLLKCTYKEMFTPFTFIPYYRNTEILQYLITITK